MARRRRITVAVGSLWLLANFAVLDFATARDALTGTNSTALETVSMKEHALRLSFESFSSMSFTAAEGTGGSNCTVRLKEFIDQLDRLLDSNPRSIDPMFALLKTYFPLEACNIEEAIKICRQSKYLSSIGDQPGVHTILFSNAGFLGHSGFQVQIGLSKETGDSIPPFAIANK